MAETWTPEAYLKVLDDDMAQLDNEWLDLVATRGLEDMEYKTGEFLRYLGKLTDNAKLLKGRLVEARRVRA